MNEFNEHLINEVRDATTVMLACRAGLTLAGLPTDPTTVQTLVQILLQTRFGNLADDALCYVTRSKV